jgi:hypothetical protein
MFGFNITQVARITQIARNFADQDALGFNILVF